MAHFVAATLDRICANVRVKAPLVVSQNVRKGRKKEESERRTSGWSLARHRCAFAAVWAKIALGHSYQGRGNAPPSPLR